MKAMMWQTLSCRHQRYYNASVKWYKKLKIVSPKPEEIKKAQSMSNIQSSWNTRDIQSF